MHVMNKIGNEVHGAGYQCQKEQNNNELLQEYLGKRLHCQSDARIWTIKFKLLQDNGWLETLWGTYDDLQCYYDAVHKFDFEYLRTNIEEVHSCVFFRRVIVAQNSQSKFFQLMSFAF